MHPERSTEVSPGARVTIADVAARAGVAMSTVSRVLNDGQVSASTRDRVLTVIGELDYHPHAGARALASGREGTIGIVVPFFTSSSAVERLRGILEATEGSGREILLCNVADPVARDELLTFGAPLERVAGLLIVSLAPRDAEARAIMWTGVPTVLLDAYHPALPRLVIDDVRGGELATRHLIELGHERIAFVGDDTDPRLGLVSSHLRASGYREALRTAGLADLPQLRRTGPHGRDVAFRLTTELLTMSDRPTAIVVASDLQALGALEAAEAAGVTVPDALSVVGFDDLEVARYAGLTTVDQGLHESGRRGMNRLLSLIDGHDDGPLEQELPLALRIRRTTGPPPRR